MSPPSKGTRIGLALAVALGLALAVGACTHLRQRSGPGSPSEEADPPARAGELEGLRALSRSLAPLQAPLGDPQPGDWLVEHEEAGQTFEEWLASAPRTARGARRVLYVLPLGSMTPAQEKVVADSVDYLGRYFQLEVKTLAPVSEDAIPAGHKRDWSLGLQLHSKYILDEVLYPRVPEDAAALIALTAIDLYPKRSWNFVFGQASLRRRVGVWSMRRNGDPEADYRKVLERTLGTATHETGHMLSIQHCTAYLCNMCGSNSMAESDRHPLQACAECLPKVLYATQADSEARYRALIEFCEARGLSGPAGRYRELLAATRSRD